VSAFRQLADAMPQLVWSARRLFEMFTQVGEVVSDWPVARRED